MNLNFGYATSINYINLIIFIETFVMANIFGIRLARRDHYPIRVVITFFSILLSIDQNQKCVGILFLHGLHVSFHSRNCHIDDFVLF